MNVLTEIVLAFAVSCCTKTSTSSAKKREAINLICMHDQRIGLIEYLSRRSHSPFCQGAIWWRWDKTVSFTYHLVQQESIWLRVFYPRNRNRTPDILFFGRKQRFDCLRCGKSCQLIEQLNLYETTRQVNCIDEQIIYNNKKYKVKHYFPSVQLQNSNCRKLFEPTQADTLIKSVILPHGCDEILGFFQYAIRWDINLSSLQAVCSTTFLEIEQLLTEIITNSSEVQMV